MTEIGSKSRKINALEVSQFLKVVGVEILKRLNWRYKWSSKNTMLGPEISRFR